MAKSRGRALALPIIGAVILIAGVVAFTVSSMTGGGDTPPPATQPEPDETAPHPDDDGETQSYVYPSAADLGFVPEPITTAPKTYVEAAVEAYGTYDTTGEVEFTDWERYLRTWQNTYPTILEIPGFGELEFRDQDEDGDGYTDLRDTSLIGEREDWMALIDREGKAVTKLTSMTDLVNSAEISDVSFAELEELYTVVEFTQWQTYDDGTGADEEITITRHGTARVVLNCTYSTPAPESEQQPGDCKLKFIGLDAFE